MSGIKPRVVHALFRVGEVFLSPLTFVGGMWLRLVRRYGIDKLPLTRAILLRIGVFPIREHYYEPQFKFEPNTSSAARERTPGVDLNIESQLELIGSFKFQNELSQFPLNKTDKREFYYNNHFFEAGDAEYLYSLVRLIKPKRVIEIGSGMSTLMIRNAVKQNQIEDPKYQCAHTCIEPYEHPWLADVGVELIRERVERMPLAEFEKLGANDIFFIDSSHIIRSGGDVLHEYLEILPRLKSGVYVHIHDIFTPFDYPDKWVREEVRFWNEQYLLEAFLSGGSNYAVIGALYYLSCRHPEAMKEKFPILATAPQSKPGSFWIKKR